MLRAGRQLSRRRHAREPSLDARPTAPPLSDHVSERAFAEFVTHDHHDVEAGRQLRAHAPKRLPQQAFGAIALDRIADAARGRDAKPALPSPRLRASRTTEQKHERRRHHTVTGVLNGPKLGALTDALSRRKPTIWPTIRSRPRRRRTRRTGPRWTRSRRTVARRTVARRIVAHRTTSCRCRSRPGASGHGGAGSRERRARPAFSVAYESRACGGG
jgi:hypothetical protein